MSVDPDQRSTITKVITELTIWSGESNFVMRSLNKTTKFEEDAVTFSKEGK